MVQLDFNGRVSSSTVTGLRYFLSSVTSLESIDISNYLFRLKTSLTKVVWGLLTGHLECICKIRPFTKRKIWVSSVVN